MNTDFTSESYTEVQQRASDQSKIHLICLANRPSLNYFMTKLEYTYFPPRTPKNAEFDLTFIKWPDEAEGMLWTMISVPAESLDIVKKTLEEAKMKIANGVPILFTGKGEQWFPIRGSNVFSLENSTDHPIYARDHAAIQALEKTQTQEIEAIFANDEMNLVNKLRNEGLSEKDIANILDQEKDVDSIVSWMKK